jgi:hypothetical protein
LDERMIQAKFENAVGERVDFGSRPRCPKCLNLQLGTEFCRGKESLVPAKGVQCPLEGEHLHRICQCGNHWIERCADSEDTGGGWLFGEPEGPDIIASLVKMAGGRLVIPSDVLAEVQADMPGVVVREFEFGVRLTILPSQAPPEPE